MIALTLMLACAVFASAQSDDSSDLKPMFGIRAGFDVNIPGYWHTPSGEIKMYRHGYGGNIGGVCNIYLGKNFYFEPGVTLFYDTYSYDDIRIGADPSEESAVQNPSLYKIGLRIPLIIGYSFALTENASLSVFTGPEINWAFAGNYRIDDKELQKEFSDNIFNENRRFDLAWKIGAGYPIDNLLISIDASIGITDIMKNPDVSFRENRVTVGATYYF